MRKLFGLLICLLAFSIRANATITASQHITKTACSNPCAVTGFSSIALGSFVVAVAFDDSGTLVPSAGASGVGTWALATTCTTVANCSPSTAARAVIVEYILSTTSTGTTVTCTGTGTMPECDVSVYTFTGTSMAFDVGAATTAGGGGVNMAGLSAGTLTGTNDVIIQYAVGAGTFSGCPNSAASPAAFPNGNAVCGLINSTNNAAGTYTNAAGAAFLGSITFKEAAVAGGTVGINQRIKRERLDPL